MLFHLSFINFPTLFSIPLPAILTTIDVFIKFVSQTTSNVRSMLLHFTAKGRITHRNGYNWGLPTSAIINVLPNYGCFITNGGVMWPRWLIWKYLWPITGIVSWKRSRSFGVSGRWWKSWSNTGTPMLLKCCRMTYLSMTYPLTNTSSHKCVLWQHTLSQHTLPSDNTPHPPLWQHPPPLIHDQTQQCHRRGTR